MPDCYLLAVCESSSLDRDNNSFSLFNLADRIRLPKLSQPLRKVPMPAQSHTYWLFKDSELNKEYKIRFVLEMDTGDIISEDIFSLKSKTRKFRLRILGFTFPEEGGGLLKVEWKAANEKKWKRCSIFWPFELTFATLESPKN